MSVNGDFFINDDGEELHLKAVIAVEPAIGINGHQRYTVIMSGAYHFSVKNSYYSRTDFITAWKAAQA